MKRINSAYFLPLLLLLVVGVIDVRADEELAPEKTANEVIEAMKAVGTIGLGVKEVGLPVKDCSTCKVETPDLSVVLESDSQDLGTPYYKNSKTPYIIYLKRTSKTPKKLDLKFKNNYRYCMKMFVGTNPMAPGNPILIDCMVYTTKYDDEEISLNMKNLKPLKDGEEEVIEVRLTKRYTAESRYNIEIKNLSDITSKETVKGKFFSGGYNVSFERP